MNRVQGKTAIVTGGASGIGEAVTRLLVAEGAKVVIADINADLGSNLARELGSATLYQRLDATDAASWTELVLLTEKTFGHANILVNNVGGLDPAPIEEWDGPRFQRALDLNLF